MYERALGFANINEWLTYSIMQMNSKIFHNWSARRDIMIYNSNNWALKSNWTNIFQNMQAWNNCVSNGNPDTNPNHLLPLLIYLLMVFLLFFFLLCSAVAEIMVCFYFYIILLKKIIIHIKKKNKTKKLFLRLCKTWLVYRKVLQWNK